MKCFSQWWLLPLAVILSPVTGHASQPLLRNENGLKSAVFHSPAFVLGPGSVENKFYYNIDFPTGHIALKDFNAEVVDETGNPIPLHETYLHHWVVMRYYSLTSAEAEGDSWGQGLHLSKFIVARNSGTCQGNVLRQYYGLGSETRRTSTYVPDPYGIEAGNPTEIPDGYAERWMLNVHAIDTRGVVDRMGCTECKCDLYNVTKDEHGRPLAKDYTGGLYCCYDQTQCRLREGFEDVKRKLYLRYTVKWVDWDNSFVPAKIYIFDVTDSGKRTNSSEENARIGCQVRMQLSHWLVALWKQCVYKYHSPIVIIPSPCATYLNVCGTSKPSLICFELCRSPASKIAVSSLGDFTFTMDNQKNCQYSKPMLRQGS